jgi:uncharacterized membrane protein YfcA
MDPATVISLLLILCTAFFFAPLGLGGGVLFVPIFLYIMKWDMQLSIVSSLILVLMVSFGSRNAHSKGGYAVMDVGKSAIPYAIVGAVGGTIIGFFLVEYVGDFTIKIAAVSLLVWVIMGTFRQLAEESDGNAAEAIEPKVIDPNVMKKYRGMCMASGVTSGLLGIGGGMLFVTFHRSLFSWKLHYAAGTSYVIETWMVPVGITSHLLIAQSGSNLVSAISGFWIIITLLLVYASAWIGARAAIKMVPQQVLAYPFLLALLASLARYSWDILEISGLI